VEVVEQVWRNGTRIVRPFSHRAAIKSHYASQRLQRALVDFGADEAFARAAGKVHEHYGLEVSVHRMRQTTLAHAKRVEALTPAPSRALPRQGAAVIVAEADGAMVPSVSCAGAPPGADRRKYRQCEWKEVRLVAAQAQGCAQTYYAATMQGVDSAGARWENVVRRAGAALNTYVHGLGDGAEWIAQLCLRRFGPNAGYLVDLYHVCDYLAAVWPGQRKTVKRHRDHLKAGRLPRVLAALRARLEPLEWSDEDAPARRALRYLENRPLQLDYPAAIAAGLPVGSGLIESGNRHVLQQRLKRPGAWWLTENLHLMAQLRALRANGDFNAYWSRN
jgi:hypothetical protein